MVVDLCESYGNLDPETESFRKEETQDLIL